MKVKIYSTPTCPYCRIAKDFLKSRGVDFDEVDVSASQEAVREMVAKSGQMGVPVIDIDGEIITGFNRNRITELLDAQ